MQGKRVYPDDDGQLRLKPGEYGFNPIDGKWYCRPPGDDSYMGSLGAHDVVLNEDDTITVSPSILIEHYSGWSWHGYLERGVWRQV